MNIEKSKNAHFIKEIFPNGFSLESFEKEFTQNQNIIKNDRNIVKILRLGEIETVTKSFKTPNFIQGFVYKFFRKSKARRSFEYSELLNQKGIKTPEPLGYIEVFDRFRLRKSYYISRKIGYDFTLNFATDRKVEDFREILNSFIDFSYEVHKKNIMHLDYVVGNVCVKRTEKGYDFYLVDLNRLYRGIVSAKSGVQNLARISKDPEIIKILAHEYAKRSSISFKNSLKYLTQSVSRDLYRLKLKSFLKNLFRNDSKIPLTTYSWDYHSNQPHAIDSKKLKNKISLLAWYSNLKILLATFYALLLIPFFYLKNRESFGKKIDSFGLCVNVENPIESQKLINNDELIEMIEELSVNNILVRIPLADFENIEKYFTFIKQLHHKNILVCLLQDRDHISNLNLLKERLDFIFSSLDGFVNEFQIGNSINRKKWAFLSVDEYFSFFKVAYDLKKNKFSKIKLLGGNIIDFDIPFFARSVFHLKSIFYDGVATQLYVDRRGNPENFQFGFDTLAKIRTYAALANASRNTSNDIYITEVNWPLSNMAPWAPAKTYLIEESLQSSYLVRYYLLMLASGKVKKCFWHQLIAPGYGLVNNLNGQIIKRDAYYCFKHLVESLTGGKTKKLIREKNLFCLVIEKDDTIIEAIWSSDKKASFRSNPDQKICDIRGKIIDTKNSPVVNITGEVVYIEKLKTGYQEFNFKETSKVSAGFPH